MGTAAFAAPSEFPSLFSSSRKMLSLYSGATPCAFRGCSSFLLGSPSAPLPTAHACPRSRHRLLAVLCFAVLCRAASCRIVSRLFLPSLPGSGPSAPLPVPSLPFSHSFFFFPFFLLGLGGGGNIFEPRRRRTGRGPEGTQRRCRRSGSKLQSVCWRRR